MIWLSDVLLTRFQGRVAASSAIDLERRNDMLQNVVVICASFLLGLFLIIWSVSQDVKKRRLGLQSNRLFRYIEQFGTLLVFCSLFFPAAYGLLQIPYMEQFLLSIATLLCGLFLMALAIVNLKLKVVEKILIRASQATVTQRTNFIYDGITFCILEIGMFLTIAGLGFLILTLIKAAK